MTDIPNEWKPILKFALKNKGTCKNSSFNHIPDTPYDAKDRKYILDNMVVMGYFTASKPGQVYIYTLTEKGRQTAQELTA